MLCFGKQHLFKMLMHFLPPAHSSFSSYSTQFIPCWVSMSMTSLLISFIALYFSPSSGWFLHMPALHICVGFLVFFFSMLILFPLSFSSSFHFKTDHIFPFNLFLKLLNFSFTMMVIPLRGQRNFSLFYFLK